MSRLQLSFDDPIATIQLIVTNLSQICISAFLIIMDDRNNVPDSTKDLVLNYEIFYVNSMAETNTLLNRTLNILRITENIEWINTNMIRNMEANFRNLYQDLIILYRDITNNQNILSNEIRNIFIILNRMYQALNNSINIAKTNIISRIFESITILDR
jgi:hypothetical protein